MRVPEAPLGETVDAAVDWLTTNAALIWDAISWVVGVLIENAMWLLGTPPWWVMVIVFVGVAVWARGWKFALFTLVGLLVADSMRLWEETMDTFALAIVATLLAAGIGVPLGILAARNDTVSAAIRPVLDFMQTLPVFVYLVPAMFFFGVGTTAAVVATFVFATPPSVRLTQLGIRQVDKEMTEASTAFGATPGQLLRHVQLPLAMPSIMQGINQSIMLALSMVVIAGMVGAGGLGPVVLQGLSSLDVGLAFQGGLAVVFVAIFLDRLTGGFPRPRRTNKHVRAADEDEQQEDEQQDAGQQEAAQQKQRTQKTQKTQRTTA